MSVMAFNYNVFCWIPYAAAADSRDTRSFIGTADDLQVTSTFIQRSGFDLKEQAECPVTADPRTWCSATVTLWTAACFRSR